MRPLALAFCAAICLGPPALAAKRSIVLSIDIDWTGFDKQAQLAAQLQKNGLFPFPMVYVGDRLRGLLPSKVDIHSAQKALSIQVGVAQIVERPIYEIKGVQSSPTKLSIQLNWLDLRPIQDRAVSGSANSELLLVKLDQSKAVIRPRDGVYQLALPAAPLAALVDFAEATKNGMALGRVVPIVLHEGRNRYPPFPALLGKSLSDVAVTEPITPSSIPAIYKDTVSLEWVNKYVALRSSYLFQASPLPRLELISLPDRAQITINGTMQPELTNHEVDESRELWPYIVIHKEGYRDCPIIPSRVTQGPLPTFTCKLGR